MQTSLGIPRDVLIFLLSMVVAVAGCSEKVFQQGGSSAMAPTIKPNESLLAEMSAYQKSGPQRWDVVVFHPPLQKTSAQPGDIWVKRVIGLPGESLEIRDDGVYIDGKREAQPNQVAGIRYVSGVSGLATVTYPYKIPAEMYFLVGDNTTNSFDSRFWGAVPRQSILGRVKNK